MKLREGASLDNEQQLRQHSGLSTTNYEVAAPRQLEEVRRVLIDHLLPEQLELLADLGDQVQPRLAEVGAA